MKILKDLRLAIILILIASGLLLLSDVGRREGGRKAKDFPPVAIFQIASTPLLDSHVAGIMDRLKKEGIAAPDGSNIRIFNAQGDIATANTISREIVNSEAEIVITSSTLALQNFSKANISTRKVHVFGGVTDPYGAGVGISGPNPDMHPPYMAGVGTFQPVAGAFRILKEMNPGIKKVGVVWNSGEQCSEACMVEAREICAELGIELVDAVANSTSEVAAAAQTLVAKGVEAIWIGGDTVATAALGLLVNIGHQAGIPVFTNDPTDTEKGALFGLGANYFLVGQLTADIAVQILRGKDPSEFRIENTVPEKFNVNRDVMNDLGSGYRMTVGLEEKLKASVQVGDIDTGTPEGPGKKMRTLVMVRYLSTEFADHCKEGFIDGLAALGYVENKNYILKEYNAEGDIGTLNSIMTTVSADRPDLLMTISTPTLQAAIQKVGNEFPVVFSAVANASVAGAGTSSTDHLSNVTGITTTGAYDDMAKVIKESVPGIRKVGTLFTPAEVNSEFNRDSFEEALKKKGLKLIALPVNSSSDIPQAISELCSQDIQVYCQIVDNLTQPACGLTIRKASDRGIPSFSFIRAQMDEGAVICISRDYYDAGFEAAEKVVQVLKGVSPSEIPISNVKSEDICINTELAEKFGLEFSDELKSRASEYTASESGGR